MTPLRPDAPARAWQRHRSVAAQKGNARTIEQGAERAGSTLRRAGIVSGANGVTDFAARTVTVAPHLSAAQAANTLAHELAHVTLHDNPRSLGGCRGRVEIEAESLASIICRTAGLDSAAGFPPRFDQYRSGTTAPTGEQAGRVIVPAERGRNAGEWCHFPGRPMSTIMVPPDAVGEG